MATDPTKDTTAYSINGNLFHKDELDEAHLSITDRGLLLGDGLFETLPILNGKALWWPEHLERLTRSANRIGLEFDPAVVEAIVQQMQLHSADKPMILRLTVTRGSGGRGLLPPNEPRPAVIASLSPLPASMPLQDVRLITSSIRRNEQSPSSSMKSVNYLDNILAAQQANDQGADDALLLNTNGACACTTIGNIFAIHGEQITTPPIADGVLPGIMRSKLLSLNEVGEFDITEDSLSLEQIKEADGLFVTNSLRIMRRVQSLDEQTFAQKPADLLEKLQEACRALIFKDSAARL